MAFSASASVVSKLSANHSNNYTHPGTDDCVYNTPPDVSAALCQLCHPTRPPIRQSPRGVDDVIVVADYLIGYRTYLLSTDAFEQQPEQSAGRWGAWSQDGMLPGLAWQAGLER
eukprot:scaffold197300_cov20-Prasinocladus_malaysianus.AAC.1